MEKLFASPKTWGRFTFIASLVPPTELSGVDLDETNTATVTVHVAGISNAVNLVDGLLGAVAAGQATKPALVKFSLAKDNGYDITLSFVPIKTMDLMHIKRLLRLYKTFIIQGIVTLAAIFAIFLALFHGTGIRGSSRGRLIFFV